MENREQVLKMMQERILHHDNFNAMVGVRIADIDDGYCKGEMEIGKQHLNPLGTVHGGCLYAMADTIGGYAAATYGTASPTLSGNMYFMRPVMGMKKLTCEARVIKNGKRIRVVEVNVYGDHGEEVARCILEYMDTQKNLLVNN